MSPNQGPMRRSAACLFAGVAVVGELLACGLTHDVDALSRDFVGAGGAAGSASAGGFSASGAGGSSVESSSETVTVAVSSTTGSCIEPVVPCGLDNAACCQCSPACPSDYSHCNTATGMCEPCGYAGGQACCNDESIEEKICEGIKRCVNGLCLKCCAKCSGDATIYGPLDTGGDDNCGTGSGVVQGKCKDVKDCGTMGAAPCCPSMCVANSGWCAECIASSCSL